MFGKPATAEPEVRYVFAEKPKKLTPLDRLKAACVRGLTWVMAAPFLGLLWIVRQTFSARWAIFVPVWVPALVAASALFPWADAVWAALAVTAALIARVRPGRVMSRRELLVLAAVGVLAVVWLHTRDSMSWRWQLATLLVAGYGPAAQWWWWRRARAVEYKLPGFLVRWETEVVPKLPKLAGEWVSWDDDKGTGILELDESRASLVVNLDEDVEQALGNVHRGAITLAMDPTLPVKQIRVVLSKNPRAQISRITYFDNATLDDQWRILLGYTRDGRAVHGRFARPGGGAFVLVTGGPGSGKGATMRLFGLEAAMSPKIWMPVLDCKGVEEGGSGVPELRDAADMYLRTKDEWRAGVTMLFELLDARARRYGRAGMSRWQSNVDPLIWPILDETARLAKVLTSKQIGMLEDYISMARSFGGGGGFDSQRGDGASFFSTTFRSSALANGMALVGMPGDTISKTLAAQDWDVDPSKLPAQPGWQLPLSKIDPDVPAQAIRIRYIPSDQEVAEDGAEHPFGTAEQWGRGPLIQRATLHDEDAEIVARWRAELGMGEATVSGAEVVPAPAVAPVSALDSPPAVFAGPAEASTHQVVSGENTARMRIVRLLSTSNQPLGVSEIAREVGVAKRYAGELLANMAGRDVVNVGGKWTAKP